MNKLIAASLALLTPGLALAHPGHDHGGLLSGLLHPLTGFDHLLALLGVGLWLAQSDTRPKLGFALGFAGILALAMMVGAQFPGSHFEPGIIASLVVLGALLACAVRGPMALRALIVAAVAAVHGFVHGTELGANHGGLAYSAALVFSSLLLVAATALLGRLSQSPIHTLATRISGGLLVITGVALAF